jgi:hypothetical protein
MAKPDGKRTTPCFRLPLIRHRPPAVVLEVSVLSSARIRIVTAAEGSLTAVEIAHAAATRLEHRTAPLSIELDAPEVLAEHAGHGDRLRR